MKAKYEKVKSNVLEVVKLPKQRHDSPLSLSIEKLTRVLSYQHKKIKVFAKGCHVFVPIHQILFLKAEGNYVRIVLHCKKQYIIPKTLKQVFSEVGNNYFYRCHNSFVINIQHIELLNQKSNEVKMNGHTIPISRSKSKDIMENLCAYNFYE